MTDWKDDTGQTLHNVHDRLLCRGHGCSIHRPSNHSMNRFRRHYRFDRAMMERICPHGVGHPDPDDLAFKARENLPVDGVHGCDGCCDPSKVWDMLLNELHPGDKIAYPTTRASTAMLVIAQITAFTWRKDRGDFNGKEDCAPSDPAAELSIIVSRLKTSASYGRTDPSRAQHYKSPERCVLIEKAQP